jgi:hypothetical protein
VPARSRIENFTENGARYDRQTLHVSRFSRGVFTPTLPKRIILGKDATAINPAASGQVGHQLGGDRRQLGTWSRWRFAAHNCRATV